VKEATRNKKKTGKKDPEDTEFFRTPKSRDHTAAIALIHFSLKKRRDL